MLDLLKAPKAAAAVSTLAAPPATTPGTEGGGIVYVGLRKIADNPYQPRGHYDAEHILNLALSIKRMKPDLPQTRGLQQLPMARVVAVDRSGLITVLMQGMYAGNHARQALNKSDAMVELMFGHSRLRAFMVLAEGLRALRDGSAVGLDLRGVGEIETRFAELQDADLDYTEMPLMLGFALDHQMWAHAITENSQRKNITAIEEAQSLQRAMDEFGLTMEEAGKPFGYARSTAANKVRLLSLPPEVQKAIAMGELSERHGRELVRLAADPVRLKAAADMAIDRGLSVRALTVEVDWKEQSFKVEQARKEQQSQAATPESTPQVLRWQSEIRSEEQAAQAQRQQRIVDLNNQAHAIWQRWVKDQDLQMLWNDIRFWKVAVKQAAWLDDVINPCDGVHDACQELLRMLYKRTRRYDPTLQNEVHQPGDVRALIRALGGNAPEEEPTP